PEAAPPPPAAPAAPSPAPAEIPAYEPGEPVEIVPMTPMRKTIAERMILSRRTSAHVTTVFEVDMTRVMRRRDALKDEFLNRHGVRLTPLAFVAQACIDALKKFPIFNASISGDNIVYKKNINLGIAVALDWGLIVPVIKQADEKSLLGLAKAIQDLADRARRKELKPEEVKGGTFTITNPGIFGSLFGTPIINQPQVAILGVGSIHKRPVVIEGDAIAVRSMAYLSLSFDHRLIDGALGDQFMAHIKRWLESLDVE
ncbi:MAG: 2-oxo acid dehydrogenase subunit E2, partial [Acidobacteria bacterium]